MCVCIAMLVSSRSSTLQSSRKKWACEEEKNGFWNEKPGLKGKRRKGWKKKNKDGPSNCPSIKHLPGRANRNLVVIITLFSRRTRCMCRWKRWSAVQEKRMKMVSLLACHSSCVFYPLQHVFSHIFTTYSLSFLFKDVDQPTKEPKPDERRTTNFFSPTASLTDGNK